MEAGKDRSEFIRIETWELEVAKSVARSIKNVSDREELEAELGRRLIEVKKRKPEGVKDWKAFLAKSLYNAAYDALEKRKLQSERFTSMESVLNDDGGIRLEDLIESKEEPVDIRIDVNRAVESLAPELRLLWNLLIEEEGNKVRVAKRLNRPRKTVEYWIKKLQTILSKKGIEP